VLAIAGDDFCVVVGDTRQSNGYNINSRTVSKIHPITEKSVFTSGGMDADRRMVAEVLKHNAEIYKFNHNKSMSTSALGQFLSRVLYGRRFYPYYVLSLLAGVDEQGKGHVFTYDPVGTLECMSYGCQGSAAQLIMPFLDNQIAKNNQPEHAKQPITEEFAIKVARDALVTATERDIHTGDAMEVYIIKASGIETRTLDLRKD